MSEEGNGEEKVSKADYDKMVARAQRMEGLYTDLEKKVGGADIPSLKAAKEELELLKNEQAAGTGDPKKLEERINAAKDAVRKELVKDIEARDKAVNDLRAENKALKVDTKVFSKAASKFVENFHGVLQGQIRQHCDIDDEGNEVVRDESGEPRYSPANKAKLMTHDEFIEELVTKHDYAVVNTEVAGNKQGGKKVIPGAKVTSLAQLALLPQQEQLAAMRKLQAEDPAAFDSLLNEVKQ